MKTVFLGRDLDGLWTVVKGCLEALPRKDDGVVVYRTDSGQQAAAVVVSGWADTH